jgi:hypothetical protein
MFTCFNGYVFFCDACINLLIHVVLVESNTNNNANYTANNTNTVGGHQANVSAKPPTDPAKNSYAHKKDNFFHVFIRKVHPALAPDFQQAQF